MNTDRPCISKCTQGRQWVAVINDIVISPCMLLSAFFYFLFHCSSSSLFSFVPFNFPSLRRLSQSISFLRKRGSDVSDFLNVCTWLLAKLGLVYNDSISNMLQSLENMKNVSFTAIISPLYDRWLLASQFFHEMCCSGSTLQLFMRFEKREATSEKYRHEMTKKTWLSISLFVCSPDCDTVQAANEQRDRLDLLVHAW